MPIRPFNCKTSSGLDVSDLPLIPYLENITETGEIVLPSLKHNIPLTKFMKRGKFMNSLYNWFYYAERTLIGNNNENTCLSRERRIICKLFDSIVTIGAGFIIGIGAYKFFFQKS